VVSTEGLSRAFRTRLTIRRNLLRNIVLLILVAGGAVVAVVDASGRQVARGLSNYSSEQLQRIKRLKTSQIAKVLGDKPYDEVIHRNNMTLE